MRTGRLSILTIACVASLVLTASASADTVQVTTSLDTPGGTDGCTLRDAAASMTVGNGINACNFVTATGTDSITFAPSLTGQTIALNGGDGEVTLDDPRGPMDVAGPGMGSLSVAAGTAARVFSEPGTNTVTISGMTIANGSPPTAAAIRGGCIFNQGELILNDVRVTNCTADTASNTTNTYADGAAIGSEGTLTLNNSLVDNNHLTSTNTANNNTEAHARGAIYSEGNGGVTLNSTTVSGNDATASDDGTNDAQADAGLAVLGGGGPNVSRSTFSGNVASATEASGYAISTGGIYTSQSGQIELTTVADNIADISATGATFPAGGILNDGPGLTIRSSTIAFNGPTSQTDIAGGNFISRDATTFSNTILAYPRGGGINCLALGVMTTEGYNDDYSNPGGPSCFVGLSGVGDITANPLLAPNGLAVNGGPTKTIALQLTSPMIDAGSNAGDTDTSHDQRGLTRPVDFSGIPSAANGTDIGAFEVEKSCASQTKPGDACPSGGGGGGGNPPAPGSTGPTGQRAAAKKHCKKKFKGKTKAKKRKKCMKHAKRLPV